MEDLLGKHKFNAKLNKKLAKIPHSPDKGNGFQNISKIIS